MIQKIIKVGNSAAITVSKDFLTKVGLRIGQEVSVETEGEIGMIVIKSKEKDSEKTISPEFKTWLSDFMEKNKELLKKLANT